MTDQEFQAQQHGVQACNSKRQFKECSCWESKKCSYVYSAEDIDTTTATVPADKGKKTEAQLPS